MPLEIKIIGDQAEAVSVLDNLHKALHRPDVNTMPLDDLLAVTKRRFLEAGFSVELTQQNPTPAEAEVIVDKIEAKLKKKTTAKKPADVAAALAEADKKFVVDEMVKRFGDQRQKLKAKAFIDTVTGRHGGVRLSLLDAELFPEIRTEMEAEFGIAKTTNGNGAGEAHA